MSVNASFSSTARQITYEGTSTPWAAAVDLAQVGQKREGVLVAQRNVGDAVVSQGAHGSKGSGLLTTTESAGGDEQTSVLAEVAAGSPDLARLVPEGLPLGREVAVTSGDTEQESIVLQELSRLGDGVVGLGRSVHQLQNIVGKSLGDLEDVGLATGSLNALLFGLRQLGDVAVQGVLQRG